MLNRNDYETGGSGGCAKLPARVILTGFRATGKSLVGALLADMIGYRFIDTDDEMVAAVQCTIAAFVREHGWPAFREREQKLLARLSWMNRVVIATGGGAVLHHREWRDLRKDSLVVWLQADARTIRERLRTDPVSHSQRPPLTGGGSLDEVEAILAEREPCYRKGSDMAIDTADRSPGEIARMIKHYLTDTEKTKRTEHGR